MARCDMSRPVVSHPVFALGVSGAGRVCWDVALTNPQPDEHIFYGPPLMNASDVYLDSDGQIIAVSLSTGKRQWTWRSGQRGIALVAVHGAVLGASATTLVGLNPSTGAVRWRLTPSPQVGGPVPHRRRGCVVRRQRGQGSRSRG